MSRISNLPSLMPDEPLHSYVSRVARSMGADLSMFCEELGVSIRGVVGGKETTVERLHELTGVPVAELARRAFRWENGVVLHQGQELHRLGVRRMDLKVCPLCLREDGAASKSTLDRAAYVRGPWLLKAVRTCTKHDVALVDILEDELPAVSYSWHDLALRLARTCHDLDRLCGDVRHDPATRLETYAVDRLRGIPTTAGFADGMPFYAAIRTAEMLGVAILFGPKTNLRNLDGVEWRAAGEVGFDVLALGAEAITSCLAGMMAHHGVANRNTGANKVFGFLHHWLKTDDSGPAYEPFRALLREVIFDSIPLAAGTEVLGVRLDRRRVHSLRSAAGETGRGLKGLRRELRANGILKAFDGRGPGRLVAIPVDETATALANLANSLQRSEAAIYLNASIADVRRLAKADLLHPIAPKERSSASHVRYSKRDLDDFLDRLMRGITGVAPSESTMLDLPTAALKSTRSLAALTTLVIDGKLRHVGRQPGVEGFRSVLVDLDEIRNLKPNDGAVGLEVDPVAKLLRVTRMTVMDLIDTGDLEARDVRSALSKQVITVVAHRSLAGFTSKYVSLSELSLVIDVAWSVLKGWLDEDGVVPAFPFGRTLSVVYRRSDLATLASRPRVSGEGLSRALGRGTAP